MKLIIDIPNENYQVVLTKIMLACNGCKITELPKGHGRLIDADAMWDIYHSKDYDFYEALDDAPTIIDADRSEE